MQSIILLKSYVRPAANSGFAKFGLKGLMEGSFCIFGISPKWKGLEQYKPKLRKAGGTLAATKTQLYLY